MFNQFVNRKQYSLQILIVLLFALLVIAYSTVAEDKSKSFGKWQDPSPHAVQFIEVEPNVKLEVLDWGGSGRPVILIAGLGNTAHVFDDFAPKLAHDYHVYGITRRGFGNSSKPESGYESDRRGDDVLAVMDASKIERPVLVGHSMGGSELSSVATRFPDSISGLIYLDAAYTYAYDPNGTIDQMKEMRKKMEASGEGHWQTAIIKPPQPPPPAEADKESVAKYLEYQKRIYGFSLPEAELRRSIQLSPQGRVMSGGMLESVGSNDISEKISKGLKSYKNIPIPALALYSDPEAKAPWQKHDETGASGEEETGMRVVFENGEFERGVPNAKIVRIPGANHLIFLSNEEVVLKEMRTFMENLP